ncbi:hypothetical protein B0T11DRAFT_297243 [Plectosphaerella cucumerina]|uniref:Uncharacterized protein n=1 Tax=Plectosphaerella cucumerina TaxID=40658 RepID=A0A8K0TBM6_9PEZI|nr:hypothetical protein B0T11DRAFT_297243 [Plectosphaerella cucumerina]
MTRLRFPKNDILRIQNHGCGARWEKRKNGCHVLESCQEDNLPTSEGEKKEEKAHGRSSSVEDGGDLSEARVVDRFGKGPWQPWASGLDYRPPAACRKGQRSRSRDGDGIDLRLPGARRAKVALAGVRDASRQKNLANEASGHVSDRVKTYKKGEESSFEAAPSGGWRWQMGKRGIVRGGRSQAKDEERAPFPLGVLKVF